MLIYLMYKIKLKGESSIKCCFLSLHHVLIWAMMQLLLILYGLLDVLRLFVLTLQVGVDLLI